MTAAKLCGTQGRNALHCIVFCFVLFCFVLFCFVLFCFVLFCFVLFCSVLFFLLSMLNFFLIIIIGERSEPLSGHVNGSSRYIFICIHTS